MVDFKKTNKLKTIQKTIDGMVIDKMSLDEELVQQPILFYGISELSANAVAERDRAKETLGIKDAEFQAKWRKKLEKAGERPTVQLIENSVLTDPKRVKYLESYLDAKEFAEKCNAIKESYQQRSYMLRELVALYIAGYYATSAVTSPGRKGDGEAAYEANKKRLTETRKANKRSK